MVEAKNEEPKVEEGEAEEEEDPEEDLKEDPNIPWAEEEPERGTNEGNPKMTRVEEIWVEGESIYPGCNEGRQARLTAMIQEATSPRNEDATNFLVMRNTELDLKLWTLDFGKMCMCRMSIRLAVEACHGNPPLIEPLKKKPNRTM